MLYVKLTGLYFTNTFLQVKDNVPFYLDLSRAAAQWVRALAPQAVGWMFESQPRQT